MNGVYLYVIILAAILAVIVIAGLVAIAVEDGYIRFENGYTIIGRKK